MNRNLRFLQKVLTRVYRSVDGQNTGIVAFQSERNLPFIVNGRYERKCVDDVRCFLAKALDKLQKDRIYVAGARFYRGCVDVKCSIDFDEHFFATVRYPTQNVLVEGDRIMFTTRLRYG